MFDKLNYSVFLLYLWDSARPLESLHPGPQEKQWRNRTHLKHDRASPAGEEGEPDKTQLDYMEVAVRTHLLAATPR